MMLNFPWIPSQLWRSFLRIFFWCRLPKMGIIYWHIEMQLQVKFWQFHAIITAKFVNFSNARAKFCNLYVKFDTKVKKRVIRCELKKKRGVVGCKIGVKKGVYWQALDIHRYMGVPPPPELFAFVTDALVPRGTSINQTLSIKFQFLTDSQTH